MSGPLEDHLDEMVAQHREYLATATPYLRDLERELYNATRKHGPMKSAHEGWAVLREEVDEMWDEVKADDVVRARKEALQVAAMAIRFLMDVKP